MPSFTMFFKSYTDKNGDTYYRAQTKSGKMKAQLFPTINKDSDFDYTMSLQLPKKTRSKAKTKQKQPSSASGMAQLLKGLEMGLKLTK